MIDTDRKFLIVDGESCEWADDTFTRREAAIEKTQEALRKIAEIKSTLREAADFLDQNDPMINKILSYPMSIEETEDSLRDDIAEWKRDQDELETEIFSYNSRHIKTLDNAPHD